METIVNQTSAAANGTESYIASDKLCENPECRKPATMQCPTCVKMNLNPSYFCAQECFKNFWNFHKMMHKKIDKPKDDNYQYTGTLRPYPYSFHGHRFIPSHIKKPDYATLGKPGVGISDKIPPIYAGADLAGIRLACKIGREALDVGHRLVAPGVTTEEIDKAIHDYIISNDAYPSPLNYWNFPRSCCTSINEVICHGIPDTRQLQDGDIVNIDVSVYKDGYHGDLNETYLVGKCSDEARKLVENTYISLQKSIDFCKPGNMYRELGNIITAHVEPLGY